MPTMSDKKPKQPSYAQFIGSLRLNTLNLRESSCEIDRPTFWKTENQSIKYKLSAKMNGIEKDHFDASARLDLRVVGDKTEATLVRISVTYDFHEPLRRLC